MKNLYCCDKMEEKVSYKCIQHTNIFDCPDNLIYYTETFNEYGIIIHNGGQSYICIEYCPWCGTKLPESKRMEWFDKLRNMGYESPLFDDSIPEEFKTKAWRENKTD